MGCDIHGLIEAPQADGSWLAVGAPTERVPEPFGGSRLRSWRGYDVDTRDYRLFCLMARVRCDDRMAGVKHVKEPTYEMPQTEAGRDYYDGWASDAHSLSWMDADELREVQRRYALNAEYPKSNALDKLIADVEAAGPGARFVFWFDN